VRTTTPLSAVVALVAGSLLVFAVLAKLGFHSSSH
jgi:hypothetical protein